MKHMMMVLRSELGQIFSRRLHHQQRAIKSMIVCEQLAISTPKLGRWEIRGEAKNVFVSLLKFHFDFFAFSRFQRSGEKMCTIINFHCLRIESHLMA